ncbi:MAG: hypothetical protein ACYDH5_16740 [Acidimicrobiales bacterium]
MARKKVTTETVQEPAGKPSRLMTAEHKEALAIGREQGRTVRHYLEAIQQQKPRRGRKRTEGSALKQLAEIEDRLAVASPLARLQLVQRKMELEAELAAHGTGVDLSELEADFVEVAAEYGARKGITYRAWTAVGVSPKVLRAAGVR